MRKALLTVVIGLAPLAAAAQDAATLQRMFEAGQLREVAGAEASDPAAIYLAGLSHQKLGQRDQAAAAYARLASSGPVWQGVGASAQQLLQGNLDGALESADAAVAAGPGVAEAHYQRGLVQVNRQAWSDAAAAFDRAAQLNPSMAYAHYNAGLAYYRANRPDQMAARFEQFLKLAPKAPERPEVQQIMRTIRGR